MNKETMKTISESAVKLKFLLGKQFMRPIREIERKGTELPPGFIHIMRWLQSKGNNPVSMTDLANAACVSKPNLTTMVDRMCQEGLMERSADEHDRRIVNVAMTPHGIDFLKKHGDAVNALIEKRLALLEDPELDKLQNALYDLIDILKIMEEKEKKK